MGTSWSKGAGLVIDHAEGNLGAHLAASMAVRARDLSLEIHLFTGHGLTCPAALVALQKFARGDRTARASKVIKSPIVEFSDYPVVAVGAYLTASTGILKRLGEV